MDEFFFVLEWTAKFYLDRDTVVAGPYTSFYCPPNTDHGISNAGDTELKYLVIKKYLKALIKSIFMEAKSPDEITSRSGMSLMPTV